MKPFVGFAVMLVVVLILAGCGQTLPATQVTLPTANVTPKAPVVKSETLSTATPAPENESNAIQSDIPAEQSPTPTEMPAGEPTATPTPYSAPATTADSNPAPTIALQTEACEDKAAFYDDITIPDDTSFKHNVVFEKIWRVRNEGTCTWDGYKLVWAGGSLFDAPLANPIPRTAPGEFANIVVKMQSPNQGGVYTSVWEFENAAGNRFGVNSGGGDKIWVRISVTWYPEGSSSPGVSTLPTPVGGCTVERNQAYIDQILSLINAVRQQNGLATLSMDAKLNAAAQAHSEDMACQNFIDHTGSDGSDWAARVKKQSYSYSYVSENIYAGDPAFGGDAQGAFDWWMNSPVHRDNILSKKITQIGIGFAASDKAQFKGRYTLNFAKP
jgi:uncharacterized protein YkwD